MEANLTNGAGVKRTPDIEVKPISIQERLDAKIPRDAIATRSLADGTKLSYLETWAVIDRMNQIFGHLNWSWETVTHEVVYAGTIKSGNGEKHTCHYKSRVRILVSLEGGRVVFKDGIGYGQGFDKYDPGKAHELAGKGAESDAFKRAAKNFGMSMGLALYDKQEEFVDDTIKEATPAAKEIAAAPVADKVADKPNNRTEINKMISSYSEVLLAKAGPPNKAKKAAELKATLTSKYGTADKTKLTDTQAEEVYKWLRTEVYGNAN